MVYIGKDSAQSVREARAAEYGKYIATEEIYIDGVLAFGKGFPVPISHVEKYPELLDEDAVEDVSKATAKAPSEPPAANAKRAAWADYARGQGATEAELGPVADGGLSRNALADKYGPAASDTGSGADADS
jgi:hypothetical protein